MTDSISEEKMPIAPPLNVLKSTTVTKKAGWWMAVVLFESWGRKSIGVYLWQKKKDGWKRKQKFNIHSSDKWKAISEAVSTYLPEL
ncbi:MAG: hypothetical protein V1674_06025 [Candidatus Omnitrophota bacterium]